VLKQKGWSIRSVSTNSLEQNIFGFVQSLLNKIKSLGQPNEFYKLLKKRSGLKENSKFLLWLIIAILILPLALVEYAISSLFKRGACVMVYAHKP
jgi:hypothetical protein